MPRVPEDVLRRALFDEPSQVHDRHAIGHVAHDVQVVRDDEDAEPEPVLKARQQVQHVALDGHVEAGRGLVRDQQVGLQGQRARHADAARLAAGELVRIAVGELGGQADQVEQPGHLRVRVASNAMNLG